MVRGKNKKWILLSDQSIQNSERYVSHSLVTFFCQVEEPSTRHS